LSLNDRNQHGIPAEQVNHIVGCGVDGLERGITMVGR